MSIKHFPRGFTLIELIVFIVIVSTALIGILSVFNTTASHSADPMLRKQALAIAESILEEVMLQPFTWCDPDDAALTTATAAAGCTVTEGIGVEGLETRGGAPLSFDNVSDYNGLNTTTNIAGGGAAVYTATVAVAGNTLGPAITLVGDGTATSAALLITVTVATAGGETIVLQGYRSRYAPNSGP